jgi:hypothetical protein
MNNVDVKKQEQRKLSDEQRRIKEQEQRKLADEQRRIKEQEQRMLADEQRRRQEQEQRRRQEQEQRMIQAEISKHENTLRQLDAYFQELLQVCKGDLRNLTPSNKANYETQIIKYESINFELRRLRTQIKEGGSSNFDLLDELAMLWGTK